MQWTWLKGPRRISPAPESPRRPAIDSLTSIRGLAAIWVVLYHFHPDIVTLLPSTRIFSPFIGQGHFAVPLFFVLSGFVLTHNYLEAIGVQTCRSEILRFWGRRLVRIYPLHLATLLSVLAMVAAARVLGLTISEDGYSQRDFLLNLLLMHTWVPHFQLNWNYPSWSISSEWFAYLLFPPVCLTLIRIRHPAALVTLALLAYLLSVGLMLSGDRLLFREMFAVVGPFLLGCTFSRAIGLGYSPPLGLRIGPWVLLTILVLLPYLAAGQLLLIGMLTTGSALVFALACAGPRCSGLWLSRPLLILGDASYSVYMVHTLAQKFLYETIPSSRFTGRSLAVRLLVLGSYSAAIALATWLAYVGVDTYFRKSLRRRFSL